MGKRRHTKRKFRVQSRIRDMARPSSVPATFTHMVVLKPEYIWGGDEGKMRVHDEIISVVKHWGVVRVRMEKKRWRHRTRIFFTNEASVIMLKAAFPESIWKMFRLKEIEV